MSGSKIDKATLLSWVGVGTIILAFAPDAEPVREFVIGLMGSPTASHPDRIGPSDLRAELIQPTLSRELEIGELEELRQGLINFLHGRDAEALPVLGKFALLGDARAQGAIGSMYYFGKGLPLDRDEGIRWLRLAAQQGGLSERQTLAAALTGTLEWEKSDARPEMAYAGSPPQAPQYASTLSTQIPQSGLGVGGSTPYGVGSAMPDGLSFSPRREIYKTDSAGRAWLEDNGGNATQGAHRSGAGTGLPQIGNASPVILNRAGPGSYTDGKGDFYTQAGPHGVVNTRTGEFSPTN